jgi:hypothetical protein
MKPKAIKIFTHVFWTMQCADDFSTRNRLDFLRRAGRALLFKRCDNKILNLKTASSNIGKDYFKTQECRNSAEQEKMQNYVHKA